LDKKGAIYLWKARVNLEVPREEEKRVVGGSALGGPDRCVGHSGGTPTRRIGRKGREKKSVFLERPLNGRKRGRGVQGTDQGTRESNFTDVLSAGN